MGFDCAAELFDFLKARLPAEVMTQMVPRRGTGGSDHLSIPGEGRAGVHMVALGGCIKIHSPGDDADLVRPETLDKAGRILTSTAKLLADTDHDLIAEGREPLTKFRFEEIVNCRPMPLAKAVSKLKDAANPDVDYQLATVTIPEGATPPEAKAAIAKELDAAPAEIAGGPGLLTLFGQSSDPLWRPPTGGTTLIVGLGDARRVRDDPDWLGPCEIGSQVFCDQRRRPGDGRDQPGGTVEVLLEAADLAKLVVVLDGIDKEKAVACLVPEAAMPLRCRESRLPVRSSRF